MTQQPYYYDRVPLGGPTKRKRHIWPWILLAAGLAIVTCVGGLLAAASHSAKTPGPIASKAADIAAGAASAAPKAQPSTAKPEPEPVTIGAGSWEVGTEVKPGTYTTTALDHCYWARLKGFDGDLDSIIANGNLDAGQHGRLTVKKTDKGLQLDGDCTWKLAS